MLDSKRVRTLALLCALGATLPGCVRCGQWLPRDDLRTALEAELPIGLPIEDARTVLDRRHIRYMEVASAVCRQRSEEPEVPPFTFEGGPCIGGWARACGCSLGYCNGLDFRLSFCREGTLCARSLRLVMQVAHED